MIGQKALKDRFSKYSLTNMPHTILLRGEDGCGKHTFVSELAKSLGVDFIDVTSELNFETISSIYERTTPCIYVIDLSETNERQQNVILKLLEEPLDTAFVFVLSEPNGFVLETITNRCVAFDFAPYTDDELLATMPEGRNYSKSIAFCRTPGKLLETNEKTVDDCERLCEDIVSKIGSARLPNALTIVKRINCKDEYDKIDFGMFVEVLTKKAYESFVLDGASSDFYDIICEERRKLTTFKPNKEQFLEHLIIRLWESKRE